MAGISVRPRGRAQAVCSRRHCRHGLMMIKPWMECSRLLLQLALLAMLLLATAQGAWLKVGYYDTPDRANGVAVSGSYAYVADEMSGLQIIDIINPTSPSRVGYYDTPGFALCVAVSGSYAYVADWFYGLQIIDISNPTSPNLVGHCDTPGSAFGVAVSGSYAYVADDASGLQIIDVSNPSSPNLVGYCDTPGSAYGVAVSGSYAYVADDASGLQIIDVSNPSSPNLVGYCDTPGSAWGVAVSGSYAYVADEMSGLQIIDVSNPFSPNLVGHFDTPGIAHDVVVSGSYAYVADGMFGLQIIDIINPTSPSPVGYCSTPGHAWGVAVSGSYAYVADDTSGLQIIAEGATLSGRAWRDLNGNGLQDAGEPGEPNVRIDYCNSKVGCFYTQTSGDGSHSFIDLVPGDYYVQFIPPAGETFSPKDQGNDDSIDSDVDYQGKSDKITLDPGQSKSVDAGLYENKIIINEIYPNPEGNDNNDGTVSWERLELKNVGTADFNVGQWTIKDDDNPYILATIPDGTVIPSGGYLVVHLRGSSGGGISNSNGDPVILCNSGGVEMDRVACPASSSKEGLSYSCIPDASDNWGFWGVPTFGGSLSSDPLPGAPNMLTEDYGDAPNTFKTIRSSDGPRHLMTGPHLGSSVDYEPDGQPTANADGDGADEDGATFSDHIIIGQQSSFSVTASAPGILQAWMDFDGDGDFSDAGEQIAIDQALSAGAQTVSFSVPADANDGYTFARLRFSSSPGLASYGPASDGEVEDYRVEIKYGLGDYVWVDEDVDGIQDAGEKGLEGVTVYLMDAADNIVASQTTDADGKYLFESPAAGAYYLEFLPPAGYSITVQDQGADNGLDSDADPVTHRTRKVNVVSGSMDLSWDAGLYQPVSISGMKFHDKDANGEKGPDEPPIPGWEIQLKDSSGSLLRTTTTSGEPGKEGTYEFVDLQPGTYRVYEVQKPGWVKTAPAEEYFTVTLTNLPAQGKMFGNNQLAISGKKFHDRNGDGKMDTDEPPLSGWDIQLKDESDNLLQTTTTSGEPGKEGTYEFLNLQPDTYRVYEVSKAGWVRTYPAEEYHSVTLTNMPSRENLFGNVIASGLSGMKFEDLNANGAKDSGEPGLSGWTIRLMKEGTIVDSQVTAADGAYSFADIAPGSYTVEEAAQAGWTQSYPATTGTYPVTLVSGVPGPTNLDFGNFRTTGFSGMKFEDLNGNGAKDAGEPGLSGWTIRLMKEGTTVESKVTAADGTYSFIGIAPGSYTVQEAAQAGWTQSYPASGTHPLNLVSGVPGPIDLDFGNFRTTGFSGMKFEDINGNGAKDNGEPGLASWTIRLIKEGTMVESQVTAADGTYSFTGIAPGSYTVEEAPQSGWTQSYPASGTHPLNLVSGVPGPINLDFGNYWSTSLSGIKFEDKNRNGLKDSGEPGLAGWTIRLMKEGAEVDSTVTAADGSYSFMGVVPGSYTVEEVAQSGWTQSYPASPGTHPVTLLSGVPGPTDLDFGNYWSTVLSGMKFEDKNGNGLKDSGEPGLAGWTIRLMKVGTEVASKVTAADGTYSFIGIEPGSYTVEEVAQSGWTQSYPASPGTHPVTLLSGVPGPTDLDFGNYWSTVLSGMKFEDKNGNGLKDSGELGLSGWTIRLKKEGTEVASKVTAADGTYSFIGVEPGSYTIEEVAQLGWTQSYPASPGTHPVTLVSGVPGPTDLDFGNRRFVQALQVAITADKLNVLPGQELTFYITINHDSSIGLNSMIVEYTLPSGLSFIGSNYSPLGVTQNADGTTTITWTFAAFSPQMAAQTAESDKSGDANAPSTTITVTSGVQPDAPQSLTGAVVVTGTSSEVTIAEARGTVSVNVEKLTGQPVHLNKTSDLLEVWPGATIGYTIAYESLLAKTALTNVVITEQASPDLIFLSASPAPDQGTDNIWTIGDLAPGQKGTISVFFQVKNASNLSFWSESSVSGSGFASTYRRLSTETQSQGLRNSVTLTCEEFTPVSTSYFVKLRDRDGTSLLKTEHGSGDYHSEEVAALQMQNRSISTAGSLKAAYRPTSFLLPGGRSINYSSEISSLTRTRNRATQASTSNEIRYAKSLEMDQKLLVDKNETLISVEGSLQGQVHLGALKKDGEAVKPTPVFESSQEYAGSFRFNQSLEDYGSNVRLIGNASGQGEVTSDQRLKKSQRSYEHGNGSYESEEQASTAESYMAKDLSVSSDPAYGYGKWQSGIWSKSSGKSYLGQEVKGADYIKEETRASGLNDLSSNLSYRGQGRFRTVSEPDNRSALDLDEEYVGEYTIQRKIRLGGVSRFDRPHLTLNKTGRLVPGTAAADYTITVQNDGNTALGPVYVWDIFPAGTDYLTSSLKPNRLQPGYANWSLLYLGIGQSVTISLRLNVTDRQDELVNLVYASGGHNDEWVTAGNMSVMQFGWLGCCQPDLLLEKQARIDAVDGRTIWYRVLLKNRANVSLAAQVTDRLPAGLELLNASAEPQVQGENLVWVTGAIPAGKSRFIEYRTQAAQNGRFVNTALAEVHALDGSGGSAVQASATVTVGEATSYAEDGWRPPEWGLDRMEMICDDEIAGEGGSCGCPLYE